MFDSEVDEALKNVCLKIECRHEEKPLGIGANKKDAHFLVRSVLTYSVTKLMRMNQEFSNRGCVWDAFAGQKAAFSQYIVISWVLCFNDG